MSSADNANQFLKKMAMSNIPMRDAIKVHSSLKSGECNNQQQARVKSIIRSMAAHNLRSA